MYLSNPRQFLQAAALVALLVLAGCQTAPVQEMSDASQAISVARVAGAAEHAAADLKAAIEYLESAERNLNQRLYENARRDAENAKQRALDALHRSEDATQADP